MTQTYISHDSAIDLMSWDGAIEALRAGHLLPKADVADVFLGPSDATLLNRAAYIEGLGYSVKAVTVVRDNATKDLPTTQGAMMVFEPGTGCLRAMIDSRLVTKIKTVSDSLLGVKVLARPDSKRVLIVGAGVIARALVHGYLEVFPQVQQIAVWARRPDQAQQIADDFSDAQKPVVVAHDLAEFAASADVISSAIMTRAPVLKGEWISAGTHVDLIGAFKADMREADDAALAKSTIFVDNRDTTVSHIGELMIPIAAGVISAADVKADFYDLIGGQHPGRISDDEITLFKNGGGAHLDLMIGDHIIQVVEGRAMTKAKATATALVPGYAEAAVLACDEGLSFWGGVDPDTGVIIDAHHPNHGAALAGRIVLMPTSRGSCSGSGVLLQLARDGHAPAALVFREEENILTLGAMIAEQLFDAQVVVLRCEKAVYDDLARATQASITHDDLRFDGRSIPLAKLHPDMLALNAMDRRMLDGQEGAALEVAMKILCQMAAAQGAQDLIDVSRGHIDGCILAHDANLDFAEKMHQMGARTRIPTTINAISVDRENWKSQDVVPSFGNKASRLADAYVKMGARPTFTCAPYLLNDAPVADERIGWSESNAVIYANSVIGARTVKHPDYLDLFIAMTGRAPNTGVYLDETVFPTM